MRPRERTRAALLAQAMKPFNWGEWSRRTAIDKGVALTATPCAGKT